MDSSSGKLPQSWDDYERGRASSFGSTGSHIRWDHLERAPTHASSSTARPGSPSGEGQDDGANLRRRRSSLSMRIGSLTQLGGVNSLENFARSWQRAAGFLEITPSRPAFRISEAEPGYDEYRRQDLEALPAPQSLLRAAFAHEGRRPSDSAVEDEDGAADETHSLLSGLSGPVEQRLNERRTSFRQESIFSIEPALASPFAGSYGTTYSSLSAINEPSMRHAARLFREQQLKGVTEPDKEREPLLVRQVEEGGKVISVVVGQSTLPQTVFNSVNVLIGVGLLSLPLGLKYSGWAIGLPFFLFAAVTTAYTAKLLAKCLDVDGSLITFADLAYVSFGQNARVATSLLFTIELVATCVALVVLFADSLDALVAAWDTLTWKIVCGFILIPLGFLPLRLLSFTSVLGILCCFGIVLGVFVDGAIKPHQPGSLREPAKTYLFPERWGTVPLSFGLLMSPWGGHSVFPNIYRDMRHPYKYNKAVNTTYVFTYLLDLSMAVVGLLMFGDGVLEEVTSNILLTKGYPEALSVFIAIAVAIIPLTKIPLNARPIISTIEIFAGLDSRALSPVRSLIGMSSLTRGVLKFAIRIATTISFVVIAIIFPSFDRIMALLGAVACFTICIILPLAFHLKLFGHEMSQGRKALDWGLILVSSVLAAVSTVFAILPKEVVLKM